MNLGVVGGGPAGLRAAEVASLQGMTVTLYEAMPSVGRKFLVAGHGGLNLTHSEGINAFASRYEGSFERVFWRSLLHDFTNTDLRQWALGLGVDTFIGTSGRVFPKEFKAAPLLRSWIRSLRHQGVTIRTRSKITALEPLEGRLRLTFSTPDGLLSTDHDAVVLALGGASWPQTGSDGSWVSLLKGKGVEIASLIPANCGWDVGWNQDLLSKIEGLPLKNLTVSAGGRSLQGELMITRNGLEGGALYQLGPMLRRMAEPALILDLKPTFTDEELSRKVSRPNDADLLQHAARAWKLSPAAEKILDHFCSPECRTSPLLLARAAKHLTIPLLGPRPITEAISSAGGVSFHELDENLMIRRLPGLFVAGEMLDWEAPTGGYLLQGCFATGTRAARGAILYLERLAA